MCVLSTIMTCRFILLLLTTMVCTAACKVYYVIPTQEKSCEDKPCITLTQFASNYSLYIDTTNTTLVLQPGNHMLSADLMISNISQFAVVSYSSNMPIVTCSKSATTGFLNITLVHIRGIKFTGCGRNLFILVNKFILANTTIPNITVAQRYT